MIIRTKCNLALIVEAVLLFVTSVPLRASQTDNRVVSSAKQSYVFKTYLKGDAIKIKCDDGVVSLTGTVSEESHKSMAEETVSDMPGVKSVNNQLVVTGSPASANSDAWIGERVRGQGSRNAFLSTLLSARISWRT